MVINPIDQRHCHRFHRYTQKRNASFLYRCKYVDSTIPQGAGDATYIVQGFRGLDAGLPSDGFTIQFGVGGNGVVGSLLKMAA